ncbi:MAG: hypothetical protein JSS99_07245 [Actinobacteria bacterium]|nr:hypothetical protein [Actinomycetota bacterium]
MGIVDEGYRRKVLQPRPDMRPEDWMAVPTLNWVWRQPVVELEQQVRLFMHSLMFAVDATSDGGAVQFVILLGVEPKPDETELSVVCPLGAPLAQLRTALATQDLAPAGEVDIEMRFGARSDVHVPVVVDCDRATGRYAFNNHNQLADPKQFMNPYACRSTSGFLNFIGAREIMGPGMVVMTDLDTLHDKGLDEWFRWLCCTTETGVSFDAERLLVRRDDPEIWIYDYDGS